MEYQALFPSTDKSEKNNVVCCKFLFGALRVNQSSTPFHGFQALRMNSIYLSFHTHAIGG